MIHLVPVENKRVRDPKTKKLLTDSGIKLEILDTYWFRRLKDGDVVEKSLEIKVKEEKKEIKK